MSIPEFLSLSIKPVFRNADPGVNTPPLKKKTEQISKQGWSKGNLIDAFHNDVEYV